MRRNPDDAVCAAVGDAVRRALQPGASLLCAVSGGPDSVALLYALCSLRSELRLTLSAAHFNHRIRENASSDEAFVADLCMRLQVPLFTGGADVPAIAEREGKTLEQAARDARYAFLRATAAEIGADAIALGHHMDDQAETVLLGLLRGAGAAGLRGMQTLRRGLFRPLLSLRRGEILESLRARGIAYCIDETNESADYTRNRVRALVRELERENPRFVENTARAAALLADDDDALNASADSLRKEISRGTGVDAEALLASLPALRARVLRALAAEAGLLQDFESKHVEEVLALCRAGRTGAALDLPHGFRARLDYGAVSIEAGTRSASAPPTPLIIGGRTQTAMGDFLAELVERPEDLGALWPFTVYLNPAALQGAVVRGRREGDRIAPLGAGGSKKLKDFLIDKKIDRRLRDLPVVASDGDVLWVVGGAVSEHARVRDENIVLRVQYAQAVHWQYCSLFE